MTRSDQINHEAWKYSRELENHSYDGRPDWEDHRWAFAAGAEWADANPYWHKCEDELPEPNVKVLCFTKKGTYFVAWTEDTHWGVKWSRWNCPIIAWMELPQPPIFDRNGTMQP